MRKYFLATVSSLAFMGSASAADLIPEFKAAAFHNWAGFYVGVDVGTAWGHNNWDDRFDASFSTSYPVNGVLGGVHGGWNYQTGPLVIGAEGNLAFTNARGSAAVVNQIGDNFGGSANLASKVNWLATFVGRAGVANASTLYYLVAGFALKSEQHTADVDPPGPAFFGLGFVSQTVRSSRSGYVLGFGANSQCGRTGAPSLSTITWTSARGASPFRRWSLIPYSSISRCTS
jgi:outer membrane immunogenic protein